jgi:2-polyprenyl-6-methoxyphenol hydroxylase-like FAD-dependent oxidoreductase
VFAVRPIQDRRASHAEADLGTRAVVVGAGVAGLCAAAAVAPRYREVVIVERDELPAGASPRRGVPQGRHAHALLPGAGLDHLNPTVGIIEGTADLSIGRLELEARAVPDHVGVTPE